MKMLRRLLMMVFCSAAVASCFDPPEYPDEPEIVFRSINFVNVPDLPTGEISPDSLILVLRFKDGDGNLGLSPNENYPPFNDRWYFMKSGADTKLTPDCLTVDDLHVCWSLNQKDQTELDKYFDYTDKLSGASPYDTLPAFDKPWNCTNWEVVRDKTGQEIDKIYFLLNPHYSNIFVEFQTKTGTNQNDPEYPYVPFVWTDFLTYPSCEVQGFNGRFPLLFEPGSNDSPLEGEIRYSMPSPFFKIIFGSKTLRLKVHIEDRALNQSNVVYTNDFNF